MAYLRLLDPESQGGDVVIGRVIIAPQGRGKGLGHVMMEHALKQAEKHWPQVPIYLAGARVRASCPTPKTDSLCSMAFLFKVRHGKPLPQATA